MIVPGLSTRPSGADRSPHVRVAADIVLAGLTLPLAAIAVADAVNPQWSWVEYMASHFVNGRAGWLIPLAAVSLAAGSAVVMRLAAARTRGGRLGSWLLGVWVVGMVVAGVVPADPPGQWDRPPSTAGLVHGMAGLTAFAVLPVAAVLLTRAWRRDERWHRVARALTVAVLLVLVAFAAFAITWVDVIGGPSLSVGSSPTLVGLAERLMLWAYVAWLAVAAIGLRQMIREA